MRDAAGARTLALRALCAVPIAAALLGGGRLVYDIFRPRAAIVESAARCERGVCSLRVPDRRGRIRALRLPDEGDASAAWAISIGGQWRDAAPERWFDSLDLAVGEDLRGQVLTYRGGRRPADRVDRVRLVYAWPGWRAAASSALAWARAMLG